jgi:hypothetical protein
MNVSFGITQGLMQSSMNNQEVPVEKGENRSPLVVKGCCATKLIPRNEQAKVMPSYSAAKPKRKQFGQQ